MYRLMVRDLFEDIVKYPQNVEYTWLIRKLLGSVVKKEVLQH